MAAGRQSVSTGFLLALALLFPRPPVHAQEAPGAAPAPYFTVAGTLVRPDSTPVAGDTVYCFPWLGNGDVLREIGFVGNRLGLLNPFGVSDARGRFEIRVDSAFVARHQPHTTSYAIGADRKDATILYGLEQSPLLFDLALARRRDYRLDLGLVPVRTR